jgi:hypothetical protein
MTATASWWPNVPARERNLMLVQDPADAESLMTCVPGRFFEAAEGESLSRIRERYEKEFAAMEELGY